MFACKHVLFFVTQIYSLLFCHADFADDADLSCYCGCRLYLPLLPEYYGLYYFVPYFSIKRLFFCKDSHIFRLRSIFVPYFSIKALFLWCFGDYITNHLRHLRHLRDLFFVPQISQIHTDSWLDKVRGSQLFCNFSPKSLAGLKIKP